MPKKLKMRRLEKEKSYRWIGKPENASAATKGAIYALTIYELPDGNELPKWIAKGYAEHLKGKTVVFLIPSRTDTRWWHDYCMKASEIRFIKGRLKFDEHTNSTPFPSALVIFK